MILFGRNVPDQLLPFYRLVLELARSESERERALGINLIYDHRISAERAGRFLDFLGPDIEAKTLVQALFDYRRDWVARFPDQTFHHVVENRGNRVYDLTPEISLPSSFEIVHVCNVTQKLLQITDPTVKRAVPELGLGLRNFESARAVDEVLTNRLRNEERKEDFVRSFLKLLDLARQWHPIWGCELARVRALRGPGATGDLDGSGGLTVSSRTELAACLALSRGACKASVSSHST